MADNKKEKFSQKAFLVLKVKSMGVKESKDKVYNIYETKGTLMPDNVYFTISKIVRKTTLETSSKQADFLNGKVAEFESMMTSFQVAQSSKQDFYVTSRIAPSQTGTMFEQITSQRDGEGTVWFSASGFPSMLNHEVSEDGAVTFKFKTKDVLLSDMGKTKIEISMAVADEADTQLVLASGGNYSKELEVVIDEAHIGKAEIGQGYTFMLEFDKIENESNEADAWDEEAKPTYATTILKVKKVLGKVKGYTLENCVGDNVLDSYV